MTNMAILIAGASNSYLEISRKMLKFHYSDCSVDFAYTARECLERASSNQYQLIIIDYNLDDASGIDIIGSLRKQDSLIPIVALIDEGDESRALEAVEKGANDYILKTRGYLTALPITIRNLFDTHSTNPVSQGFDPVIEKGAPSPNSQEGYFIFDKKGRILSASQDIQRITKFPMEELIELSFVDLLPDYSEKDFFDWALQSRSGGKNNKIRNIELVNKRRERIELEVLFEAIGNNREGAKCYRGRVLSSGTTAKNSKLNKIDQIELVTTLSRIITSSYEEPFAVFLEEIAQLTSQTFNFQRATVAILNKRKNVFVKHAMIGYGENPPAEQRAVEVPREVIERAFGQSYKVKVIYYNQDQRNLLHSINSKFPERRTQRRRPPTEWHHRDLILVKLGNANGETFGYISIDRPAPNFIPGRDVFHNLQIFGQLVSFAIENYYQFSSSERRARRLKQLLVTGNIFKLHMNLNDLLKEIVWSIRFSTDFTVIGLGLISKKTNALEMRAVACNNRVQKGVLKSLRINIDRLAELLDEKSRRGNCFLVEDEKILKHFRGSYLNDEKDSDSGASGLTSSGVFFVPIKSHTGKIVGILFADSNSNNARFATKDILDTLKIMANQISIAIDNRILYVKALRANASDERVRKIRNEVIPELHGTNTRHRFMERFFK